jgi:hypothetical protein
MLLSTNSIKPGQGTVNKNSFQPHEWYGYEDVARAKTQMCLPTKPSIQDQTPIASLIFSEDLLLRYCPTTRSTL